MLTWPLFAALADARTLSLGRILPGTAEGWRACPMFYQRASKTVLTSTESRNNARSFATSTFHANLRRF